VQEEERMAVSPLGDLIGFRSVLKEDAPGDRLSQADARAVVLRFLASRGLRESALKLISATPVSRPHRTDWTFVDERNGLRFANATLRYSTTVSGSQLTAYQEFVYVPEAWSRDYERLRSKNEAASAVATFGLFVTLLAMLGVLVAKIERKDVPWKLVGAFGGIAFVLSLASMLNDIPLTLFGYDTASSLSSYLTRNVVLGILGAIATGAGIAIVVAAAEPIYRERFPQHRSLAAAFSARGIQTRDFFKSVLLGYALVAFFFAYQAVFYVVAARFGAWAPADVPYSDMLNTVVPWATVLLIGFLPAVSEEGISRMFSISFLDRLGAARWLAVVLPAYIWGFGHSAYPNQPFFIRGLEVGTAGVLIGFLMLRFGVVPLLIWHFTVDAIYTALLLLRSGNAYYVVSGAIASGILLLPLLISGILALRRGGFLPAAGLSNGDVGFVPAAPAAAVPDADIPPVAPLSTRARGVLAAAALILLATFLAPGTEDPVPTEDATGRQTALRIAESFLRANGADPEAWRHVVYQGTGFAEDESMRQAKPQDEAGIPGFSQDAARYVIEKGGIGAFRRLTEAQLPLAYWVARFYQVEKKEEWKVLIDARRSRVVTFVHPIAEDAPASPPPSDAAARRRALDAARKLGYPAEKYSVLEVGTENRPKRVDTTVVLQATDPGIGEAHARLTAAFHGESLAAMLPSIRVPEEFLRAHRKKSVADWLLIAVKVVASGTLVGVGVILFLRAVRRPEFRWRQVLRPLLWTAILAAAGLANTIPYLFRQYETDKPIALFRVGLAVSLSIAWLGILLVAALGFVLLSAARPGWEWALRRRGTLRDAVLRAAIAAGGLAGLGHLLHLVASRVPSLYEPDPTLPASLQYVAPALEVLWAAGRATFSVAVLAAVAALAVRGAFFRTAAGRALGLLAIAVAMLPTTLSRPSAFLADYVPTILIAAWMALCAFVLLREHAAAWVLFGLFTFGGRGAVELLVQPAPADRDAGALTVVLLAVAGVALLAGGRRDSGPELPVGSPSELPPASAASTIPSSDNA
jgi:MFS family permease